MLQVMLIQRLKTLNNELDETLIQLTMKKEGLTRNLAQVKVKTEVLAIVRERLSQLEVGNVSGQRMV